MMRVIGFRVKRFGRDFDAGRHQPGVLHINFAAELLSW